MCVIAIAEKKKLSEEIIRKCDKANDDGIGVSWIENNKTHFKKGITLQHAISLAESLPLPYVYHFRLATVGGNSNLLCHPFIVSEDSPLLEEGSTEGFVFFHNGHWHGWEEALKKCDIKLNGIVSDSRAIAALVDNVGYKILNFINGKFVLFSPQGIYNFGDGWQEEDGIKYSNFNWKFKGQHCYSHHYSAENEEYYANWQSRQPQNKKETDLSAEDKRLVDEYEEEMIKYMCQ